MEKRNNKLALMSMIIMCLSLLMMNLGRFDGALPDIVIHIIGIALSIAIVVVIIFTVRALAEHTKESKNDDNKEQE